MLISYTSGVVFRRFATGITVESSGKGDVFLAKDPRINRYNSVVGRWLDRNGRHEQAH